MSVREGGREGGAVAGIGGALSCWRHTDLRFDNVEGSGQGLSLAEREEKELQQAVAMSLNSEMGQQDERRLALRSFAVFRIWANHDFFGRCVEQGHRPSTFFVVVSSGLLTILHSIPLAREALLLRNKPLFDYGHDPQWWNGQPINLLIFAKLPLLPKARFVVSIKAISRWVS
jgi:hypothetical protein